MGVLSSKLVTYVCRHARLDAPGSETWDFQQYGAEVFGTNGECLFTFPVAGGPGVLVDGAPKPFGDTIARVRDFLVGTNGEATFGTPDPPDWAKDEISEEVFEQPIEQDFGCVKAVTGGQSASVFTDCSIQRFDYTGGPFVFRRTPVETARGLVNSESLIEWGQSSFGLFTDGFGVWDGSRLVNIDEHQVREWAKRNGQPGTTWCQDRRRSGNPSRTELRTRRSCRLRIRR